MNEEENKARINDGKYRNSSQGEQDYADEDVPKSIRGLVPGGPMPGAIDVRCRARGELPIWSLGNSDDDDSMGSSQESKQSSSGGNDEAVSDVETAAAHVDIFTAEIVRTPMDELILIDGVRTTNPKLRRLCLVMGFLVLFIVVAVSVASITSWLTPSSDFLSSSQDKNERTKTSAPAFPDSHAPLPTMTPTGPRGNLSWTIADSLIDAQAAGSIVSWFLSTINGQIFLETMNRTDTNFTTFAVMSDAKPLDALIPLAVIIKVVTPLWYGHFTDVIENYFVEGQLLAAEDLQNGMVLKSMSGYPLIIQRDPFLRVNNVTVSEEYQNYFFKNGVAHYMLQYPIPVVPYLGKSSFDVLLGTNDMRNGDLSHFVSLIESSPNFQFQLQLREGDTKAITLFVPTNHALSLLDPTLLADPNLLLNHVVSGNFVRRRWWVIPTGTKVSNTELRLESQAGNVLNLTIEDSVIINGVVTIIEADIFSEQGVLHVIDCPLLV